MTSTGIGHPHIDERSLELAKIIARRIDAAPALMERAHQYLEAFELHRGQWLPIATAKDDDSVSIRPFDAISFSLADLWP